MNSITRIIEDILMKKASVCEPQIPAILRQAEGSVPETELCREHDMSTASFDKWRARYGRMPSLVSAHVV